MKPKEFPEQNVVFAKDQPEYQPLPAFKNDSLQGEVVSCWELSDEEISKLKETKCIWVSMMTFNKPLTPHLITVNKEDVLQ